MGLNEMRRFNRQLEAISKRLETLLKRMDKAVDTPHDKSAVTDCGGKSCE